MKKLAIIALAAVLLVAFTIPAAALESEFGGYWRTRMFTQQNFYGESDGVLKSEARDFTAVDTRTRLYYTAIFHENLKFVNKFEFDATWGTGPLGDIGADGKEFEIKNSYADFNLGPVNAKVGIQGTQIARGFMFDDDFSGAHLKFSGESFYVAPLWIKANEGGKGKFANDEDVDYYALQGGFNAGSFAIKPFFLYNYSKDGESSVASGRYGRDIGKLEAWYLGTDVDVNFDALNLWFTGIYQGGSADVFKDGSINTSSEDFKAYLLALGASFGMSWGDIHGQFVYASGDDKPEDGDFENFVAPKGQSYYWSEIMGLGMFDQQTVYNSPGDQVSNIYFGNLGVGVKPMDKLSVVLDLWYASRVEETALSSDKKLGTEVDLKVSYKLLEGLNLDVVGAYLFADDGVYEFSRDDDDPYEVGTRLSLSF